MSRINVKALQLFRLTMEFGSLRAAAEKSFMSQPAASRLISGLEAEIGFDLFRRHRQRLIPTVEGEQFFTETLRILSAIDELPRVAERVRRTGRRRLNLVCMPRLASLIVLPAVGAFARAHADVECSIEILSRREMEHWLANLQFDIGLGTMPVMNPAIDAKPLVRVPTCVALPAGHPLAARAHLGARDLAGEDLIVMPEGTRMRAQVDQMFGAEAIDKNIRAVASSLDVACRLVAEGVGVTITDQITPLTAEPETLRVVPWLPRQMIDFGVMRPAMRGVSQLSISMERTIHARFLELLADNAIEHADLAGPDREQESRTDSVPG